MPKNKKTAFFIAAALSLLSTGTGLGADYVPSSVLASGQWVKVHVDSTSVYRIDYHILREWGFTEPEKVRVFGYGSVEQAHLLDTAPDDLPPVAVHHSGDALYFYGEGDDRTTPSTTSAITSYRNFYSRGSNYFLTASQPGTVIADAPETEQDTPTSTHISIDRRLPDLVGGQFGYERRIYAVVSKAYRHVGFRAAERRFVFFALYEPQIILGRKP